MKLIVQIPCLNEVHTLAEVVEDIPKKIEGISKIEILVIDDGSVDGTSELARELEVEHIIRHKTNRGLAYSFRTGIDACLGFQADIIVNTDGDNQYAGKDIAKLVQPIIRGNADIVIGDRDVLANSNFSWFKKRLQVLGSGVIREATGLEIKDAVSGFRAISRNAAMQLNIVSDFSYTIEMLIQASAKKISVVSVPIATNPETRVSRLFKSIPQFLMMSMLTLARIYTMYKPLRVFFAVGIAVILVGLIPIGKFLYFYFEEGGAGHIQSLVLGGVLLVLGSIAILFGVIADLIGMNRKLLETALFRLQALEDRIQDNDQC